MPNKLCGQMRVLTNQYADASHDCIELLCRLYRLQVNALLPIANLKHPFQWMIAFCISTLVCCLLSMRIRKMLSCNSRLLMYTLLLSTRPLLWRRCRTSFVSLPAMHLCSSGAGDTQAEYKHGMSHAMQCLTQLSAYLSLDIFAR